jgi:small-conductance mechanosensitive channel
MQQRNQLTQQLDQYNALAGRISSGTARQELDRRIDNTRQALAQVETRIQNAQKYLEPSSEFAAILRKNNGNLDAALKEEQNRQVERKRQEQAAGLEASAAKQGIQYVPDKELDRINVQLQAQNKPMLPRGTTQEQVAQLGVVTKPELSEKQTEALQTAEEHLDKWRNVATLTDPDKVGPLAGRLENLRQRFGFDVQEGDAMQRALLAELTNDITHKFGGANLTANEIDRIQKQLPKAEDPAPTFFAKLKAATQSLEQTIARKRHYFEQQGYFVPKPYEYQPIGPNQGAAPAQPPAQTGYNAATPPLSTVPQSGRKVVGTPVQVGQ